MALTFLVDETLVCDHSNESCYTVLSVIQVLTNHWKGLSLFLDFFFKIFMVLKRLREYWEMEGLDFSNFTDVDINSLGTFLRGLAEEELKRLPEKILLTSIRRLGEQTGLPEDKLKARAFLAVELFKVNTEKKNVCLRLRPSFSPR